MNAAKSPRAKPPREVFDAVRRELWARADDLGWAQLSDADRSGYYKQWTTEPRIGGALGEFLDPRAVRVYLKDTVMKPYLRDRLDRMANEVLQAFGMEQAPIAHSYIKPHGRRLASGCIVCWGNSRDWKAVVMAAFERSHHPDSSMRSFVGLFESGHTSEGSTRALVRDAARRLGVERIEWFE